MPRALIVADEDEGASTCDAVGDRDGCERVSSYALDCPGLETVLRSSFDGRSGD